MRIRIGKDIKVKWAVLTDGSALPLNKEELTLELAGPNGKSQSMEFEVEGNVLTATFYGKDQNYTGDYMLTLWKNKGKEGQSVVDKTSAFSLVRYTPQEDLAQKHDNLSATLADLGDTSLVTIDGASKTTLVCNLTGYKAVEDASDLPMEPSTIGYLVGDNLYVYVGEGGDTLDGKYKNCGPFRGLKGDRGPQGNSGYRGEAGELEVVNDLTSGGEAAALSAEQGKVLDSKKQDKLNYYTENNDRAVMQASYVGMFSSEDTNEGGKESTGLYASKGVASLYYAERDAENKVQHEDGLYLEKRRENGGGCVLLRSYNAGGVNSNIQIAPEKVSIKGAETVEATAPEVSVKATGGVKFETQGTDSTSAYIEMLGGDEPDLDLHTDSNLTIFGNNSVAIESDNNISVTANSNIDLSATDNISMSSSSGKIEDVVRALVLNANAIATLTGKGEGSVTKKVTDEIAKIVDSAPEAFDTLKEIADYITEDMRGAEEIVTSLGALNQRIHELGDFATAKDAEDKAREPIYSGSDNISIIHYTINRSTDGLILQHQDVEGGYHRSVQTLFYHSRQYVRFVWFTDSTRTVLLESANFNRDWWETSISHLEYDKTTHTIKCRRIGQDVNRAKWITLPSASTSTDGLMTMEQVKSLEGKQDSLQYYTEETGKALIELSNGTSHIEVSKDSAGMYAQDGKSGIVNSSIGSRLVYMKTATDANGEPYTSHRDDISIGKHDENGTTHITLTSKSTHEEAGAKLTNTSTIQVNPNGISMSSPEGEIGDVVKAIADKQNKLATYVETDKESAAITTESNGRSAFLTMDSTTSEFDLVATDGEKSASVDADLNSIQISVGPSDGDNTGVYIEENNAVLQSANGADVVKVYSEETESGILLETVGNISAQSSNGYIKDVVKEITDKAPKVGYAPDLKVNFAKELVGRGEATEEVIGGIRPTGVRSIGDGNATIERIKGNSVVWNQLIKSMNRKDDYEGITTYYDADTNEFVLKNHSRTSNYNTGSTRGVLNLVQKTLPNHKYCLYGNNNYKGLAICTTNISPFSVYNLNGMFQASEQYTWALRITKDFDFATYCPVGSEIRFKMYLYDLTKMFTAGNEPKTIEEFEARKPFGVSNEYNEGTIVSYNGDALKSVGFNAWDEEWEVGSFDTKTGVNINVDLRFRAINPISVIPKQKYKFVTNGNTLWVMMYDKAMNIITPTSGTVTVGKCVQVKDSTLSIPDGVHYIKFYNASSPTYNNDICIHIAHTYNPERYPNGYAPYEADTHVLPDVKSILDANGNQLFPNGLLSAGSVHDEITATKAIKRIGVVIFDGSEKWSLQSVNSYGIANFEVRNNTFDLTYKGISDRFVAQKTIIADTQNEGVMFKGPDYIYIRIKSTTASTVAQFKTWLSQNNTVIQGVLATPIEVDLPEPLNMTYEAWDFGTEELVYDSATTPLNADIVYQFNAVDRIRENSSAIDALEEHVEEHKDDGIKLLDNGNLKLTLKGETREFMPATPSGDPMHWAYVSAGAEYNATNDFDIKDAPWKGMVDTIEDKATWGLDVVDASKVKQMTIKGVVYNYATENRTSPEGGTYDRYFIVGKGSNGVWVEDETKVLHLPKCWYLNGLGDITNAEMRSIYTVERLEIGFELQRMWMATKARSIFKANKHTEILGVNGTFCFYGTSCESLINSTTKYDNTQSVQTIPISNANAVLENSKIKYSTPFHMKASSVPERTFKGCTNARILLLFQIKSSVILSSSPLISKLSVKYMIDNATPTSAITITLHADAYARLKDDADIVAALAAKTLVTLVSA